MIAVDASTLPETLAATDGVVIVEFGAEWCPPCRLIEPVLAELSARHDVSVVAVDTDASPDLARAYDVMSVPTLIFFVDGRAVRRIVGARGLSALEAELALAVADAAA